MFKVLIVILVSGGLAYAFADLKSQSVLLSVILPIVVFVSLVSFVIWLVLFICDTGMDKNEGIQKVENNAPVSPDDLGGFGGGDGGS